MARFDYYRERDGFLLDCQADLLSHLNTRFVVPLMPRGDAPPPAARLNPVFSIEGTEYVMVTQFAAAILAKELGPKCGSLSDEDRRITNALDMLMSGF